MTDIMRHFSINRILFLVVLLVTYMSRNVQGRLAGEGLVGGVETSLYEIPYLVSISNFGLHLCGGTIINEQFILTAAHCVIDYDNEFWTLPLTIEAGVNDLEDENLKSRVKVVVETAYVPTTYNGSSKISNDDIAVLKLKRKLNLAHNIALNTLELPPSTEGKTLTENISYEKTEALVVGFGWNKVWIENVTIEGQIKKVEDGDSDGKMLKAKAWIQPNFQCQTFYIWSINDSQICANIIQHPSDVPQGVCSGDSGGPLVVENTVIGIVSYNSKGCDDRKKPAVYTRVSTYIDFINNAMKNITDDTMRIKSW